MMDEDSAIQNYIDQASAQLDGTLRHFISGISDQVDATIQQERGICIALIESALSVTTSVEAQDALKHVIGLLRARGADPDTHPIEVTWRLPDPANFFKVATMLLQENGMVQLEKMEHPDHDQAS